MAADLIPPVPDDQSLNFIMRNWLFKMRRNVNQFVVDISTLVTEIATAITPSNPLTTSNISSYVNTDTIDGTYLVNINADKINAGAIRGINVNASAHTTRGSYLTAATTSGDTTVNVKDTTDFASSGTAIIIDPANDRDSFTYTGKTATTLTGCSGVGTHGNNQNTIVPLTSVMVIDKNSNEMRFYGNRGDAVNEELGSVGITANGSDTVIGKFGSNNSGCTHIGVLGLAYSNVGVSGVSNSLAGVQGQSATDVGVKGISTSNSGVYGFSTSGFGAEFLGNATRGHIGLTPLAGRPSNRSASIAMIYTTGGSTDARTGTPRLMYADGTDWRLVSDDTVWTG